MAQDQSPKVVLKVTISTVLDAFDVEPEIGPLLRTFRLSHNLSLAHVASRLDVSRSFIHDVESGHRNFSVSKLRRLLFFISQYPDHPDHPDLPDHPDPEAHL
jgi:predicted transcriptional regulator